ncbi:MAG: GDSL-type esterase/lipase family protein [Pseudomonadota bacterium]
MTTLRICFVGDSMTNGTLDAEYLGWPGRLCRAEQARGHDLTLYNLGVRADTSTMIEARWHAECRARLPDHTPGALVFAFGVNDMAEEQGFGLRVPLADALATARRIIAPAAAWLPTLWIGPAPVDMARQPLKPAPGVTYDFDNGRIQELSAAYARLSEQLNIPYLDLFTPLSADADWSDAVASGDGVHAVSDGYRRIARLIEQWSAWRAWFDAT